MYGGDDGARTRDLCRDSTKVSSNLLKLGAADGFFQRPETPMVTVIGPLLDLRPLPCKPLPSPECPTSEMAIAPLWPARAFTIVLTSYPARSSFRPGLDATEKFHQLGNCGCHELRPVVHVDVGGSFDDAEFLRLLLSSENFLGDMPRYSTGAVIPFTFFPSSVLRPKRSRRFRATPIHTTRSFGRAQPWSWSES
jgi:hypothetical protein